MSWCCNLFPPSSRLLVLDSSLQLKNTDPKLLPLQNKQKRRQFQRASNVVAYYGLKTPPYPLDALEPYMSRKTLEIHWGKHHRAYVEGLNKQLANDDILYGYTLDELIKVWNHDFFWDSMQPAGGEMPELGVLQQIEKDFGSFTNFKEKFIEEALTLFGSGWVWLVLKRDDRRLAIIKTSNANNPLVWDDIPIICLDMWEREVCECIHESPGLLNAAMARMARAEAFVNLGEPKIPVA